MSTHTTTGQQSTDTGDHIHDEYVDAASRKGKDKQPGRHRMTRDERSQAKADGRVHDPNYVPRHTIEYVTGRRAREFAGASQA